MRRMPRSSPLKALLVAFLFLWAGAWLSVYPEAHLFGLILMGFALLLTLKALIAYTARGLESAAQINLLHESRILSGEYGQARLATLKDRFVLEMAHDRRGLFIGTLEGKKLFYDPFARGNGHMLTYAKGS